MEHCIQLIMAELRRRGVANSHTLAYQSRVGPVEWLQPYTDDRCGAWQWRMEWRVCGVVLQGTSSCFSMPMLFHTKLLLNAAPMQHPPPGGSGRQCTLGGAHKLCQ